MRLRREKADPCANRHGWEDGATSDCRGSIRRRDAGRCAVPVIGRHGKGRALGVLVLLDHLGQLQFFEALPFH